MKVRAKTFRNDFRIEATADEVDVTTKPSFGTVARTVAIIAPNNLIESHHYKRHKKIRMTEFHSPSISILIITQSKASFLVILNYSKMIPRLVESFRNLHLFHSNATKT